MICILLVISSLSSCDCYQRVSGSVVDGESGLVLSGVTVFNKDKAMNTTTTDSLGQFNLANISGGFRCSPMYIRVQHPDYIDADFTIPAGGHEEIKLKKAGPRMYNDSTCMPKPDTLDRQEVILFADQNAEFPGGRDSALLNYLSNHLFFRHADQVWPGTIRVTFVIDTLGNIRNECFLTGYDNGAWTDEEARVLQVIRNMPKWKPAEHQGKKVYTRVVLPIRFR